jgi:DNA-binding MarR family transcriptional regulator
MASRKPAEAVISQMGRKLRFAHATIRSEMAARGMEGIDVSHGDILYVLLQDGPQRMSDLSRRIDRDKSTVTSLIGKLERRGYVQRRPDPRDGRGWTVELTGKGKRLKPDFDEISRIILERFWQDVPPKDRETFMEILSRTGG